MDVSQFKIHTSHQIRDISEELSEVFLGDTKYIPVSHLPQHSESGGKVKRILGNERLSYKRRDLEWKHNLHWGQLKLHLTEIEFLNIVMENYRKSGDTRQIIFIYVGAAPGQHNDALLDMFPEVNFELYDPNPFAVSNNNRRKIFQRFFVDKDAKDIRLRTDEYIIFCSDIRTEPATEDNVAENMELQLRWWKIINPEYAMFKFRLRYSKPGITRYPEGDIYIQPFVGPTSTETRLIVKKNAKLIAYDDRAYEERCFYVNTVVKQKRYDIGTIAKAPTIATVEFDQCYDCASMIEILNQWGRLYKKKINSEFVEEFIASVHKGKTMYSKTIEYTKEMLQIISRRIYEPCGNNYCKLCNNKDYIISKGKSLATNDAFEQANKK